LSISIYYGTQSNIWVKSYCHLNWLGAFVFSFEPLDILRDSIGHPSKKLLSLEFAQSFCFQFWAFRYITGLNWTSELKVIVIGICYELSCSISSVSIYYETQSNIRVKTYCCLNLLGDSILNFEHLDIFRDSIGHPSKMLLSLEFGQRFYFQIWASRYITRFNSTSELKVIVVWICYEVTVAILSVWIYYWTQSDIRLKSYCRLNLVRGSIFKFEHLDILRDLIWHSS